MPVPGPASDDEFPTVSARLREALTATDAYVNREEFRGYDPYDALSSPIFTLPLLNSSHYVRLAAQQVLKRLPINVRPLLRIKKRVSAVTLARMLEGYAHLFVVDAQHRDYYGEQISTCLAHLAKLRSRGHSGDCWGYEFDWEARYASIPAGVPNIVATGIVTNALFEAYRLAGITSAFDSCATATDFVLRDLQRTEAADGSFCWSYSPLDRQVVLNATMKAARLCAQVYSVTGDASLRKTAHETVRFVVAHQRADGAWPYAVGDARTWVDNFHTGYLLECLDGYERHARDNDFAASRANGWTYYRRHFLTSDHVPKYFDHQVHPIDATACAQTITTLCTFDDTQAAARVAVWTLRNMRRRDGAFAYRRGAYYANCIPYLRWSIAPMFSALSRLLYVLEPSARSGETLAGERPGASTH